MKAVTTDQVEVVLLALDFTGREEGALVSRLQQTAPEIPVIVVERTDSELGLEAVGLGARDCLSEAELATPRLPKAIRSGLIVQERRNRARKDVMLFDNLLENLPERIYFKDRQSRFIRVNQAMAELFQVRTTSEVIGKTDFDFFTDEHARPAFEDEQLLITEREARISKVEKETFPDGRVQWVLTTKMPLRSPEGGIIGTFGVSQDITKLRETEEALEKERNQLRRTSTELAAKNREMASDLDMARKVQMALLPRRYPVFPPGVDAAASRLRFEHRYIPAQAVGGDFFTILPLSDSKAGILVCDVMGHGPRAALVTAIIRTMREELRSRADQPGEFLSGLNAGLLRVLHNVDIPVFCTAIYLVVDAADPVVEYSCAGHPSPVHLRRQDGRAVPIRSYDARQGPCLGLFEDETYPTCRFEAQPADRLLLFTDGLTEVVCHDDAEYGVERLARQLEASIHLGTAALLDSALDAVRATAREGFADDVCLVCVEKAPAPGA
jgi:sigma-B regulation protein RsbU (phosphoserine phosphatase)